MLTLVKTILIIKGVDQNYAQVIQGTLIVLVVMIGGLAIRQKGKRLVSARAADARARPSLRRLAGDNPAAVLTFVFVALFIGDGHRQPRAGRRRVPDARAALDDVPLRGGARADRGRPDARDADRRRRPLGRHDRDGGRVHGLALRDARRRRRRSLIALAIGLGDRARQRDRRRDLPRQRADHDARHLDDHARAADRAGAEAVHRRSCPSFVVTLGSGRFLTYIPYDLLVWAPIAALIILGLRYSGIGRMIYAVGDNPAASRLAGRAHLAGAALRLRDLRHALGAARGSCSSASTTPPTSASPRRSCSRRSRRS